MCSYTTGVWKPVGVKQQITTCSRTELPPPEDKQPLSPHLSFASKTTNFSSFPTLFQQVVKHMSALLLHHTNVNPSAIKSTSGWELPTASGEIEPSRTWRLFHIRCDNSWKRSKLGVSTKYSSIKKKKITVKIGNRCLSFIWHAQKDLDNLLLLAARVIWSNSSESNGSSLEVMLIKDNGLLSPVREEMTSPAFYYQCLKIKHTRIPETL